MDLPAQAETVTWARAGGIEHYIEKETGARPFVNVSILSSQSTHDDVLALILVCLDDVESLLPPEPFVEDEEGEEELAEWRKECAKLREAWPAAFAELALRMEERVIATECKGRPSRDDKLNAMLSRYPHAFKASDCRSFATYQALSQEVDDTKAAELTQKVVDEALFRQYHLEGARLILDTLLAYRAVEQPAPPLEILKTSSPRVRRIVHQMAEKLGLYTLSRDDSGNGKWADHARKEAWISGKSGWKLKKTVLCSHTPFNGRLPSESNVSPV